MWLNRRYQSATDQQLYEILERVRRENLSLNYPPITEIFSSWANNAGFPILNVEVALAEKRVKVS